MSRTLRRTARALGVMALGATLLAAPSTAGAETARVGDRSDDGARATDISALRVHHGERRVRASIVIPDLRRGQLTGTELLFEPEGHRKAYVAGVLRDRQGRVVKTQLGWRPVTDPIEPTVLACDGIRTSVGARRTAVSVPTSCLTRSSATQRLKAKVRVTNGTLDLTRRYFDDQTRFTRYLSRGATSPQAQVEAGSGLVVRSLPTTRSARTGVLAGDLVFPVECRITGSLVYRDNDASLDSSNQWYQLPGEGGGWVSALYSTSTGPEIPTCGGDEPARGRVTTDEVARYEAPTRRSDFHGAATAGDRVEVVCKMRGQRVDGRRGWYHLDLAGLWVPAQDVSISGARPAFC